MHCSPEKATSLSKTSDFGIADWTDETYAGPTTQMDIDILMYVAPELLQKQPHDGPFSEALGMSLLNDAETFEKECNGAVVNINYRAESKFLSMPLKGLEVVLLISPLEIQVKLWQVLKKL
ncbi:hypothetical protein HDU67_007880 [Dinochytrium kinnereticum]|nr:hypothetical protein HDU67_007880 [Dinochytrium kinnereticum]